MGLFDGIRFPYFNTQELNLDWIMTKIKELMGFMPTDGDVGDILMRKSDGAAWETPSAVQVDIDGLPEDTQIMNNDQLIFYDISAQANRKIKPPNLLDSMCSDAYPYMDGTAAPGTSKKPARYDHVHPTDTSRAPANYFQNGSLKLDHGGTGADNASDARDNLGVQAANISSFGELKMDDGTLIQWGTVLNTANGYSDVVFNEAFVNDTYVVLASPRYSNDYPYIDYRVVPQKNSNTGVTINFKQLSSTNSYTTIAIADWCAIGRWKS